MNGLRLIKFTVTDDNQNDLEAFLGQVSIFKKSLKI